MRLSGLQLGSVPDFQDFRFPLTPATHDWAELGHCKMWWLNGEFRGNRTLNVQKCRAGKSCLRSFTGLLLDNSYIKRPRSIRFMGCEELADFWVTIYQPADLPKYVAGRTMWHRISRR